MSSVIYKTEYPEIQAIVRFHDQLDSDKRQDIEEENSAAASILQKMRRMVMNIFKTMRDSAIEVVDLVLTQAKKAKKTGAALTAQDKQVTTIKQELLGAAGNAYEPLLENHIGDRVIVYMKKGEKEQKQ